MISGRLSLTASKSTAIVWKSNCFLLFIRLISFSWCLLYTRMIAEQACYRLMEKVCNPHGIKQRRDMLFWLDIGNSFQADASSFWVMPRSALASTSLQVIMSVTVFMSISISVFIYMHLQIQNYSGLFRYNNPTVLSVPKKGLMNEHGRIFWRNCSL